MKEKGRIAKFVWKITYAHVIAYFFAGLFALYVIDYKELFATDSLSLIMRPTTDPIVALGPLLQIFRGILLALAIYPLRTTFFEEKRGYAKLCLIMLVFSLLSTIGPTMGSLDGYIYTKIPAFYQFLGYPEAVLYILLFTGILRVSNRYGHKITVRVLPVILMFLIAFMGIMGYFFA